MTLQEKKVLYLLERAKKDEKEREQVALRTWATIEDYHLYLKVGHAGMDTQTCNGCRKDFNYKDRMIMRCSSCRKKDDDEEYALLNKQCVFCGKSGHGDFGRRYAQDHDPKGTPNVKFCDIRWPEVTKFFENYSGREILPDWMHPF